MARTRRPLTIQPGTRRPHEPDAARSSPTITIAFGHTQTAQLFNNAARPADNHTVIIEFIVDDVDSGYERLKPLVNEWVQEPTSMPWGNRSILFRDPDGNLVNLVNLFTPVTGEAIKRFSCRLRSRRMDCLVRTPFPQW